MHLKKDLSIDDDDVFWEFGNKPPICIKLFEEFPYYLYKAVWDEDFEVIFVLRQKEKFEEYLKSLKPGKNTGFNQTYGYQFH